MKKILSILEAIILTTTGASSIIACSVEKVKTNKDLDNQDENKKLQDENKKLQDENKKLKWKIEKNILFINSINPPIKVEATKRDEVKEYEVLIALKPKVLEAIKTIDNSLTENDFILAFKDYFNHFQPRYIDLSTSKKITIIIIGKNKATGQKEFVVVLPKI
ncbi:MAG: lipoprotein [Spiroplasma sp. hy2]|uniref:lipoprotein n=1 Tax=Spiroplasma sp. hy2 TaxID=2490850 RepID=UPI00383E7FDD